eukprot:COSAG02_NODE_6316_length_3655_cov_2.787120_2_plen_666_part_00
MRGLLAGEWRADGRAYLLAGLWADFSKLFLLSILVTWGQIWFCCQSSTLFPSISLSQVALTVCLPTYGTRWLFWLHALAWQLSLLPGYNPQIRRLLGTRKLARFLAEYSGKYFEVLQQEHVHKVRLLAQPQRSAKSTGSTAAVVCTRCDKRFASRNALFKHLRKSEAAGGVCPDSVEKEVEATRQQVSAKDLLGAASEALCRYDTEQTRGQGVPLAWLVDGSRAKSALRRYTRESGALARAAKADGGYKPEQLEPLQPGWWVIALRELYGLLSTQPHEFEFELHGIDAGGSGRGGGGSGCEVDGEGRDFEWNTTALKRIRVRLVAPPADGADGRTTGRATGLANPSIAEDHRPEGAHAIGHHDETPTDSGSKRDGCGAHSIQCVCVTGFHHTGTTLLRHMLGSHPDAYEMPAEIAPTIAKLRRLRKEAEDRGAKVIIIKQPCLNMRVVRSLEKVCREDPNFHVVKIRRNLPDTMYSISLRFHQPLQSKFTTAEMDAYREVYSSDFMKGLPEVMLERLSAEPEHTLRALCASLNTGQCRGACDHGTMQCATSHAPVVLAYDGAMLLYYQNELRVDNRGRRIEIISSGQQQSQKQSQEEEPHDARRVRQINSNLHYELHPWREKLRGAPPSPDQVTQKQKQENADGAVPKSDLQFLYDLQQMDISLA